MWKQELSHDKRDEFLEWQTEFDLKHEREMLDAARRA
ncbi:hypothetical protein C823_004033 [Eubacterium plexicaudatum ASF492]|nr:hypothetical protein C823_004033 [Eubacterium plexicaudatum ASF492]